MEPKIRDGVILSKKIRRKLEQQAEDYKRVLDTQRPKLSKKRELERYSVSSNTTGKRIAKIALRYMSVQTAFDYASSMINQDMSVEGVELDVQDGMLLSRKIARLEIIKILLDHFSILEDDQKSILAMVMNKEFNTSPKPLPPASKPQPTQPQQTKSTLKPRPYKSQFEKSDNTVRLLTKFANRLNIPPEAP